MDEHACDDPIRCSDCLAERSAKATARRSAAKRAAVARHERSAIAARARRGGAW